jgi:hypothetical protein
MSNTTTSEDNIESLYSYGDEAYRVMERRKSKAKNLESIERI